MGEITTKRRITILLAKHQLATGERLSPRRLAQMAGVPKDMVYRLDAGQARYIDLQGLARLCEILGCRIEELLVWNGDGNGRGRHDSTDQPV